jgi:hypothetical protein
VVSGVTLQVCAPNIKNQKKQDCLRRKRLR